MSGYRPAAYSHLGTVLVKRRLTVPQLRQRLAKIGVPVNIKSLYRLAGPTPLQRIDTRILSAICHTCEVGVEEIIGFDRPQLHLQRLGHSEQARLNRLMEKNNEGALTASERREFETLVDHAHRLSLANAKALLAAQRNIVRVAAKRSNGSKQRTGKR